MPKETDLDFYPPDAFQKIADRLTAARTLHGEGSPHYDKRPKVAAGYYAMSVRLAENAVIWAEGSGASAEVVEDLRGWVDHYKRSLKAARDRTRELQT